MYCDSAIICELTQQWAMGSVGSQTEYQCEQNGQLSACPCNNVTRPDMIIYDICYTNLTYFVSLQPADQPTSQQCSNATQLARPAQKYGQISTICTLASSRCWPLTCAIESWQCKIGPVCEWIRFELVCFVWATCNPIGLHSLAHKTIREHCCCCCNLPFGLNGKLS